MPPQRVQYIGSRELHRDLPKVLDALGDASARVVLTVHSKPRAVLIGAEAFLSLLQRSTAEDRLLAMQLDALVQGLSPAPAAAAPAVPALAPDPIPIDPAPTGL